MSMELEIKPESIAMPHSVGGEPVLEALSVCKSYGPVQALQQTSFAVRAGEIVGLVGPNGAGKTTLLRITVGLLGPDSGKVNLFGRPACREAIDQLAYLPEERGIYTREKVGTVVRHFVELKGHGHAAAGKAAMECLELLDLLPLKDKRVRQLSKGNQQRVQLAAAIAGRPRLALLDEPMSGLDPVNSRFVAGVISRLAASGCAVLLSTHQMPLVESICQRVLMINQGRFVLDGDVQAIRAAHSKGVVKVKTTASLDRCPLVASTQADSGALRCTLQSEATPRQFLQWLIGSGAELSLFEEAATTLEDVFVEIVSGKNS